jgi:hypothetical protein
VLRYRYRRVGFDLDAEAIERVIADTVAPLPPRPGEPQGWGAIVPLACLRPLRALGPDGDVRRIVRKPLISTVRRRSGDGNSGAEGSASATPTTAEISR